ncbi:MAG: hypothetical protein GY895_10335, partial [Phycisphaera sp.]|nr:hypothetical protein [Phycisphaera sp.]
MGHHYRNHSSDSLLPGITTGTKSFPDHSVRAPIGATRGRRRRGLTIQETTVATATATIGITILAVTMGAGLGDRTRMRSAANLFILGQAHDAYAMDWMGRQWTLVPDEFDEYDGNISEYISEVRCLDSILFGNDAENQLWGFWIGGRNCEKKVPGYPGSWNAIGYNFFPPYPLSNTAESFGSRLLYNARGFRDYVSGKTYDPTFFQPGTIDARLTRAVFDEDVEYHGPYHPRLNGGQQSIFLPGYNLSPSAMWGIDVHRAESAGGWQDPRDIAGGYASPSVDQCLHPDLKTRMMERWWIDGAPSRFNPLFDTNADDGQVNGGFMPGVHWFSNLGHEARSQTLFFDGSIATVR